jgi:hypothetical protein
MFSLMAYAIQLSTQSAFLLQFAPKHFLPSDFKNISLLLQSDVSSMQD